MKSNRSFSLDMEEARRRLEVWRKSRSRGKRMPAPLWALAAALARTHGVSPVSQRLGLDYNGTQTAGGGRLCDGFAARRLGSATTKRSGDSNEIEPVILVGY